MHLTSHITHSNGYAPYIAYYRSNGFDQRFRKLKPKPKLNPTQRSQITDQNLRKEAKRKMCSFGSCQTRFRILKPIQKSSKHVWVFRNTGANAFAKNQMRLAYEDKRDLYCRMSYQTIIWPNSHEKLTKTMTIVLIYMPFIWSYLPLNLLMWPYVYVHPTDALCTIKRDSISRKRDNISRKRDTMYH